MNQRHGSKLMRGVVVWSDDTTGWVNQARKHVGVNHGSYNTLEKTRTCEIQCHGLKRIEEQTQRDPRYPSNDNDERNDEE